MIFICFIPGVVGFKILSIIMFIYSTTILQSDEIF